MPEPTIVTLCFLEAALRVAMVGRLLRKMKEVEGRQEKRAQE